VFTKPQKNTLSGRYDEATGQRRHPSSSNFGPWLFLPTRIAGRLLLLYVYTHIRLSSYALRPGRNARARNTATHFVPSNLTKKTSRNSTVQVAVVVMGKGGSKTKKHSTPLRGLKNKYFQKVCVSHENYNIFTT